jgi:eukaryotic-like serine/threonine-protein kinase
VCPSSEGERHDASAAPSLDRGAQIGRFVVLGLLGRGGMGEVYAAHDPELDRRVAIKVLRHRGRRGGDGDASARLLREAQAIAKVSHPNVVVVYDVGTVDERIFIAMEFVDGNTLGYWMQAKQRTLAEILEVFGAAARGLGAAHEKELVHRDFKPDNVMVAADGQVRVMDFGLVRFAIDREKLPGERTPLPPPSRLTPLNIDIDPQATHVIDAAATPTWPGGGASAVHDVLGLDLTRVGTMIGTPTYMSPEQFHGDSTDARSDQFSFCVALYEAIYGERPFAGPTIAELAANVTAGSVRPEPAGALRVPASIRKALLRGLSVDPAARFPSMEALLAALHNEPALSGVRRFTASALAKLEGVWEAPLDGQPADSPTKGEIRAAFLATGKPYASAAFDAASRVLDRFARRWVEIYVDSCEATHVRGDQSTEVLDLRMTALQEALDDLRALCKEFRQATPDTVEKAVNAAGALGTLERCSDVKLLRAIVRPHDDPATRESVKQLQARLTEVRALQRVGRVAEALKRIVPLEQEARATGYAPLQAEALYMCGVVHENVGDIDTAVRTLEEAVWAAELCRHDEVATEAASWLVYLTGNIQSRFDVGEIWSRLAETVLRRMGGHDRFWGWLFNNRGTMRATQGRIHEALEDLQRAVAAKEKALGPDDPDVAISIGNAATFLEESGDTAGAAEYGARALRIMEATLGLDHPSSAVVLTNQAEFLNRLGRYEEAEPPARRALEVFERETDPEGVYVTYPLMSIGLSHVGRAQFQDAVAPLERAVRIREAKENAPAKLADVHWALARALAGAGGDAARAVGLAGRAQREYLQAPSTPATRRELAEIDRFLAEAARGGIATARSAI